ncbi:MAG: ATP-grasp domain-containing protein [Tumebacillaceae bacterium]
MKIGVMGWDYEEFESTDLIKAGEALGHEMTLFTLSDVQASVVGDELRMSANGVSLRTFDVIISRAQVRYDNWQMDSEMYEAMAEMGLPVLDPANFFLPSESKLLTMQKLAKAGLTVPETFQCRTVDEIKQVWQEFGQIVIKPSYGYAGCDVERVSGEFADHVAMVEAMLEKYHTVLVQRYIPHPGGDIRTTVIGDEIAFGIRRIPNERTWKANLSLGASYERYEATDVIRDVTMRAVQTMGITIAGLDILEHEGKHYILEVNNVPGWYFFEDYEEAFAYSKTVIRYAEQWALKNNPLVQS